MNTILCEKYFESLAKENPAKLISVLSTQKMSYGLLARGLKTLALCADHELSINFLIPYLNHEQPMIQEGALLGLQNHRNSSVIEAISKITSNNEFIQEMIRDFLIEN